MGAHTENNVNVHCLNCATVLSGHYCHSCGQKHFSHRLNTKILFSQFLELLTEFDGRLWTTLRELALNPGKVALKYIEGGRTQFLNPIRFLFVSFTIYFAFMIVTGAQVDIASRMVLPNSDSSGAELFSTYLEQVIASQMDIVVFLAIPLLTLAVRWQYFRARRNYAETFTFICFTFGLGYLFASVLVPIQFLLDMNSAYPKNIITGFLFVYGARTFFSMSWARAILSGIITATAYFIIMPGVSMVIAFAELYWDQLF